MYFKGAIVLISLLFTFYTANASSVKPKLTVTPLVRATNNTKVPSPDYIIDAVKCLEEAYSIYDNDQQRAEVYGELFQEKHNGTWNVIAGYTVLYTHASMYIETTVVAPDSKKVKKDTETAVLYQIFSSE